jgi:hypothetical protein
MITVKVNQLLSKTSQKYPWNFRVEFMCDYDDSILVGEWIEQQQLPGLWNRDAHAFYTTKDSATLCALRWA